jgi:hypothetical protein
MSPVECHVNLESASFIMSISPKKSSDLAILSTFASTADAQIAKGILDEVGIDSMIRADNAGGMYPAISGAELLVRAEDLAKANDALHRRHHPSQ